MAVSLVGFDIVIVGWTCCGKVVVFSAMKINYVKCFILQLAELSIYPVACL